MRTPDFNSTSQNLGNKYFCPVCEVKMCNSSSDVNCKVMVKFYFLSCLIVGIDIFLVNIVLSVSCNGRIELTVTDINM